MAAPLSNHDLFQHATFNAGAATEGRPYSSFRIALFNVEVITAGDAGDGSGIDAGELNGVLSAG